jgi:DNA-binding HxlR family transcriptional regulator
MGDHEPDEMEYDVYSRSCPSRPTLEHVTGRWGTLALGALETGPLRFNALLRRVDGISQKMLAQTLLALERDGFVHRENRSTAGLHVEYQLTDLGRETAAQLSILIGLLESRMPDVLEAQRRYDQSAGFSR